MSNPMLEFIILDRINLFPIFSKKKKKKLYLRVEFGRRKVY